MSGQGHDKSCDWWQLGILLMEMMTGTPPWTTGDPAQDSEVNIFARITSYAQAKPPKFPYPAEFPGATAEFVDNLLEPNPTKRMGARGAGWEEIKMQPWFAGFNWQGLATGSLLSPFEPVCRAKAEKAAKEKGAEITEAAYKGDASWYEGWSAFGIAK